MGLHRPTTPKKVYRAVGPQPLDGIQAAVQPLLERVKESGAIEQGWQVEAWHFYDTPEARFAARQFANAFSSTKLVLGRRTVLGRDPEPVEEPSTPAEYKALDLLHSFAGGPEGQSELLDRWGIYATVTGDAVLAGAYDPARIEESRFARWQLYSPSEVRWDGQRLKIRTSETSEIFQEMPEYIRHIRTWNPHPRYHWESDSPIRSSLDILRLIQMYDARLSADAMSRLVGAGVWFVPQGLSLPTSTGDPSGGTPNDFLRLMMDVAKVAIQDPASAAAKIPIMIEADPDDIEAATKGLMNFWSDFDQEIGGLQEAAIRRFATAVDLPAEALLGLASAQHWSAALISEDKVQSFLIPSIRRAVGNITQGWLKPALAQFGHVDPDLVVWFDPSAIKTRIDTADEAQWAKDRFMISTEETKYATGLSQATPPDDEDLKRQLLLHLARELPEYSPDVLRELGIDINIPGVAEAGVKDRPFRKTPGGNQAADDPRSNAGLRRTGRSGPQASDGNRTTPLISGPGRTATGSTKRDVVGG